MLKIENVQITGWEHAIRGMRNPKNSWDRSDSLFISGQFCDEECDWDLATKCGGIAPVIKENDHKLMSSLAKGGPVHAKYRRMITVYLDITAPLYWWKEFDTYKVGTVANSCSTMHKIHAKEFTLEDFSYEHLITGFEDPDTAANIYISKELCDIDNEVEVYPIDIMCFLVDLLNVCREKFLETNDKKYWWQMIQLLPTSYNQKRTVMLNYEVLCNIYKWRRNHKLDEWHTLCDWIESLPYSEIITMREEEVE